MVQLAFAVVMAQKGVWATILEEQAAAVGTVFPVWAQAALRAAEQARRPAADVAVVCELLDTFGRWAEVELDKAVSVAGTTDLEHGPLLKEQGHFDAATDGYQRPIDSGHPDAGTPY
jgi:hypothetical protein